MANHQDKTSFIWNGKTMVLHDGQLLTGRKELSTQSGIPPTTIERILKYLENEHQIGQQKTTKYRVITIINWKDYQKMDTISDNKRTTNGQQTDTFKNVKNDNNVKKYSAEGAEVLKAFETVDPKNKTYYGNKTQRAACDFLISEYGLEKVLSAVAMLPQINQQKLYIKQITTPWELKEGWVKIGNALRQLKDNQREYVL